MPLRDRETGHLIAAQDVVVLDLLRDPRRIGHGLGDHLRLQVVSEETEHFLLALDEFGAGVAQTLFVGDQLARQDAEQGVVRLRVIAGQVVGVVGGHQRDPQFLRDLRDLHIDDPILR